MAYCGPGFFPVLVAFFLLVHRLYVIFSNNHISLSYSLMMMDQRPFKYPACPIPEHSQEPLSRLCLDSTCPQRVPICCICQFETHQNHNTIPIVHILDQLKQNSEDSLSPIDGASKLAALRTNYFEAIASCKRSILHELGELESKGQIYFNSCEETLLGFFELGQPLSSQVQADPRLYRRFFSRLLTLIPTDSKKDFSISDKIENLMVSYREKSNKFCDSMVNLESSFKKQLKSVESFFGKEKVYEPKWSETLKGSKIKILKSIAEQSGMESSGQRFCLMDEQLSQNQTSQWAFKVKKFVGWVGIGICLKNVIKASNYHFNYSSIGHGSYLISTNGYTWSHSIKEFNSSSKCFSFTANDTVYIEFDPINLKIRFRKNQGKDKDKYELSIVAPPAGDVYHPCVNLCSTGDSVEIIHGPIIQS